MKVKLFFFAGVALGISLLLLCSDSPTEVSSPEYAASTIMLLSSTSDKPDTVITDSVGREIKLIVTYKLGYFIDSVHIDIFSDSSYPAGETPDTQLVIRFGEDDLRDTTRFTLQFTTVGKRYFVVRTFKYSGLLSLATATANIIPSAEFLGNHAPHFKNDAPKRVYRFQDGELVVFPVNAEDIDNDTLFFRCRPEKSLPRQNNNLLHADGFFQWQSEAGDSGIYHITFIVSDGYLDDTIITALVIGNVAYNSPPLITSSAPAIARVNIMYEYLPEAVDEESDVLFWELGGTVPEGVRFDSLTGRIRWLPNEGTLTGGPMVLKVSDGGTPQQSDSQRIVITVEGVNRAPSANPRIVSTGLGIPVDILLFALDPDPADTVFTFEITDFPKHGSAVVNGSPSLSGKSSITYTPAADFSGVDTIRFTASDGVRSSDAAMIKIYVNVDNQKPVARGQEISTKEDVPLSLLLFAEDAENAPMTYSILKTPRHGTLSGSSDNRLYTPHINFFGADTFTFVANDGQLDSDPAMVIIRIAAVNDTPVVMYIGVPAPLNTPVTITLAVSDPDDSLFSFAITRGPAHGTIDTANLPALVYTPSNGYSGVDTLMYRATDAQGAGSIPAGIVILIGLNKIRPVAKSGSVTVAEDSSVVFELQGSSAEKLPLTYSVIAQPKNGLLTGTDALRKYQPNGNFAGSDSFSFIVSDGTLVSEPATMAIHVTPVNDLPAAESQSIKASLNTPVPFVLSATDIDIGDTLFSYRITAFPKHGMLDTSLLSSGRLQYTPDLEYKGGDTVKFTARDPSGGESKNATVTITVGSTNERPVANPQNVTINEDETKTIFLTGSDVETSNLNFSLTRTPSHGQFEGSLPNISYSPKLDYNGVDTFYFTVSDGLLISEPARVFITILPVNDAPVAQPKVVATKLNKAVTVTLEAEDADGMDFTYLVTTGPQHGTIDTSGIKNGTVVYAPSLNYKGYDTLLYRAFDESLLASQTALVSIGVALDNQVPIAFAQTVKLKEGETKAVTLDGMDLEGAPLTYAITQGVRHGAVGNTPPKILYTPTTYYSGPDTLKFTVNDGKYTSSAAVVNFIVEPVNDAPIGNVTTVTTNINTSVTLSVSGWDPDGGPVTYRITTMPAHGTLDTTNLRYSSALYTPSANYSGQDVVKFVVTDQTGLQSNATTITITVQSNQKPVANSQTVTTNEDVACNITLSGSDPENAPLTYSIVKGPGRGVLSGSGTGRTYKPNDNVNGADTFTFQVNDGFQNSNTASVIITIKAVNDPPVAAVSAVPTSGTAPLTVAFSGSGSSDIDGDALTYAWSFGDGGSGAGVNPSHTYTAAGSYTATLTVSDGKGGTKTASAAITVTSAAKITTHPVSQAVLAGQTATFTVAASGTPAPTYQWQKGGVNITGATGASYTTPATVIGDDNATFRCVVSNIAGTDTSTAAILTVTSGTAPTITSQPVSTSVFAGETATFTVAASGIPAPTYQWQKGGVNITGAATATYTTPATVIGDDGATFRCVVSNIAGTVTSTAAILTVTSGIAPEITLQPVSTSVLAGATATFTVAASGTPAPTYQWQKNNVDITGASAATYTTPATEIGDDGATFRCVVSNVAGTVTSTAATLTVTGAVAPEIALQPIAASVLAGATATFTVAASGTPTPTYQWQKNNVDITGATGASYTTPATVIGDDGATFRCVVSNVAGTVTSTAATLTVTGTVAPTITSQPIAASVLAGETATFTVAASGTPAPTYQWQKNNVDITGATGASYTTPVTVIGDDGATFRCVVSNTAGTVTSDGATLTVTSP